RVAPRGVSPAVVHSFDAHAARADVVDTVAAALDRAGVACARLPGPRGTTREIAVAATDRAAARAAIGGGLTGDGWAITPGRAEAARIRVTRALAAPGGELLTGPENGCDVTFWTRVDGTSTPRADGDPHLPGTLIAPSPNGVTAYLSARAWASATGSPTRWLPDAVPDVFDVDGPVDVVYTWVDGTDPAWVERKAAAQRAEGDTADARHASATDDARYLSRDELRYSMRSVAMYAGWVRRIYLVTDGQVPAWLDPSHPKIEVVDHRDIFTDPSALPTFNSHAIESQLHHIDGLSERYLYLNDDMFFGAPIGPELFFHSNGLATFFVARDTVDLDPASARDLPVISAAKNLRSLLERDFGVTARGKFRHAAHPQLRSAVAELEARYPEMFAAVAHSRFRHPDDLSIPSALVHYWFYLQGRAVPGELRYRYQDLARPDTARRLDEIARQRPQAFCLNDVSGSSRGSTAAVVQFLRAYYPLAAPWETAPRETGAPG
ncbi:stealth family protein, partial [Jatrophihabitans endophyticus]|uniref:stealth family protein n=1 Tax=Jatrophihabitans endophyticus TaxID=1206085 RepID=UPI001A0318A4